MIGEMREKNIGLVTLSSICCYCLSIHIPVRYSTNYIRLFLVTMVLFPCVSRNLTVRFVRLELHTTPVPGARYVQLPQDSSPLLGTSALSGFFIDERIMRDKESKCSVISAISTACLPRGYLTCFLPSQASLGGASLGLATAVELAFPGLFPTVAFTGYVSALQDTSPTFGIHPVDKLDVKIHAALSLRQPFVCPFQSESDEFPCSKQVTSNPQKVKEIGVVSACSLLEAVCAAYVLI